MRNCRGTLKNIISNKKKFLRAGFEPATYGFLLLYSPPLYQLSYRRTHKCVVQISHPNTKVQSEYIQSFGNGICLCSQFGRRTCTHLSTKTLRQSVIMQITRQNETDSARVATHLQSLLYEWLLKDINSCWPLDWIFVQHPVNHITSYTEYQ